MSLMPSDQNIAVVWSISDLLGTVNSTEFPLTRAPRAMVLATTVFPPPVGRLRIGRR
jgi:hypothetical protein